MNPDQLTLVMVMAAVVILASLCMLARREHNAWVGKRLIEAAGSRELAELAIAQTRDLRLLNEALRRKEDLRQRRSNVVRLVPRITNRGRAVTFVPDGAA